MNRFTDFHLLILEKITIDCDDIEALYGDYVEGDLPTTLKARFDGHMGSCPCCRQFEIDYSQVIELAGEMKDQPRVSLEIQNRLRQSLNEQLGIDIPMVQKESQSQ